MDFESLDFLIAGQLKTSRTETLEDYLCKRARGLGVIGFVSPFASYDKSRCTLYKQGKKAKEFGLASYRVKKLTPLKYPLISISFLVYIWSFFSSVLRLRRRFDVFIGIATFSAFLGLLLKSIGVVDKVIYYCLDYYPTPVRPGFSRFVNRVFKAMDKRIVKKADIVWSISPRIKEARFKYAGIAADSYRHKEIIVPLGYKPGIFYDLDFNERERWALGFIGTLSENQGLQMVVEAMPGLIKKFPEIKVHILGHGAYARQLKKAIADKKLDRHFIFHGFVYNDNEAYNILSRCMAGLATWTGDESDNSVYADPGKPKLYALLGLPVIITRAPYVAETISETGAGEVIDYSPDDLILAVEKIIAGPGNFESYRKGVNKFRPYCLAENIFDKAFREGSHVLKR